MKKNKLAATTRLPDFDTLKRLASEDPESLEYIRQHCIKSLIESAPEKYRPRLLGLQFEIDSRLKLSKNPIDACISLSKMMHDSFFRLNEALNNLSTLQNKQHIKSADIIPFPNHSNKQ
jgi:hypothetical protein